MEGKRMTERDVAKSMGKTQQYVSSRLNLLRLEPEIKHLITSQLVPPEHGYELSKLKDPRKRRLLADLCRNDKPRHLSPKELRDKARLPVEELTRDSKSVSLAERENTRGSLREQEQTGPMTIEQIQPNLRQINERLADLEFWTEHRTNELCGRTLVGGPNWVPLIPLKEFQSKVGNAQD